MLNRAPRNYVIHAEGKTKIIWKIAGEEKWGVAWNKPFVTAGDGKYCEYIPGKDKYVTTAACNVFDLLNKNRVSTHFHGTHDEYGYFIRLLTMVPIEVVIRFIAYGSYLERNPNTAEGERFLLPVVEFFYKNDDMHDPIMIWDSAREHFLLYDPHKPLNDAYESPDDGCTMIGELNPANDQQLPQHGLDIDRIITAAVKTAFVLEKAFKKTGVTLVDLKIECGYDEKRKLYVADQIDADSCRLWMNGDKTKAVDKDRYRRFAKQGELLLTPEKREELYPKYAGDALADK